MGLFAAYSSEGDIGSKNDASYVVLKGGGGLFIKGGGRRVRMVGDQRGRGGLGGVFESEGWVLGICWSSGGGGELVIPSVVLGFFKLGWVLPRWSSWINAGLKWGVFFGGCGEGSCRSSRMGKSDDARNPQKSIGWHGGLALKPHRCGKDLKDTSCNSILMLSGGGNSRRYRAIPQQGGPDFGEVRRESH